MGASVGDRVSCAAFTRTEIALAVVAALVAVALPVWLFAHQGSRQGLPLVLVQSAAPLV